MWWASFQTCLGIFGAILVLCSLWFTGAAAIAATRAAKAAEQATAIASDTAKRQLRAYVSNVGTTLEGFAVNLLTKATVSIQNDGQTPAHGVTVKLALAIVTEPNTDFEINVIGPKSKTHLGPGAQIKPSHKFDAELTAANRDALLAGTKSLYFFGEIDYFDIFNEPHKTRFRFYLRKEEMAHVNAVLSVCAGGNDAS